LALIDAEQHPGSSQLRRSDHRPASSSRLKGILNIILAF
jgi:hypothetical protein